MVYVLLSIFGAKTAIPLEWADAEIARRRTFIDLSPIDLRQYRTCPGLKNFSGNTGCINPKRAKQVRNKITWVCFYGFRIVYGQALFAAQIGMR